VYLTIILLPVRSRAFRSCRGTCAAFSIELDCTKHIASLQFSPVLVTNVGIIVNFVVIFVLFWFSDVTDCQALLQLMLLKLLRCVVK